MPQRNETLNRSVKLMQWHAFFSGLRFFLPILFIYFKDIGLSFTEIGLLLAIQNLTKVLLEIPTGYLSDYFGNKKIIIISNIIFSFAFISYGLGTNFYQFLFCLLFTLLPKLSYQEVTLP